jgi:hypothetical protein
MMGTYSILGGKGEAARHVLKKRCGTEGTAGMYIPVFGVFWNDRDGVASLTLGPPLCLFPQLYIQYICGASPFAWPFIAKILVCDAAWPSDT